MKTLILLALVACSTVSGAPVYDPNMSSVREPTGTEYCAFEYTIRNPDDQEFVLNYAPADMPVKADDEVSGAKGNKGEIQDGNKAALTYARRILAGEVEIPVAIELKVIRYNPDNQMFITNCMAPELALEIDYSGNQGSFNRSMEVYGRASGHDVIILIGSMHALVFDQWDNFSGLQAPPEVASVILKTATNRTLNIIANCRLIPNSMFKSKGGQMMTKAEIVTYRIDTKQVNYGKQAPLPAEILGKIQLVPYVRTPSENDVAQKMEGKLLTSSHGGLLFKASGSLMVLNTDLDKIPTLQGKIRAVAGGLANRSHWYITGSKLVMVTDGEALVYDYAITDNGMSISGIDYHKEDHIALDGNKVVGVP